MAVHKRSPFHTVRNNTSNSSRVTRKGGLFIVCSGVHQLADGLACMSVSKLTDSRELSKQDQAEGAFDPLIEMESRLKAWLMLVDWKKARYETS